MFTLVDTLIPRILDGLVAIVVVVPVIVTSYRYASGTGNLNRPTPATVCVCQLEQEKKTIYPVKPTSCYRYSSRRWNLNRPTSATVCFCQLVKPTSSFILPFKNVGLLAEFEPGYLGTRMNPILNKGTLVLRQANSGLGELTEISENFLLGELVSPIEQVDFTFDLSDLSDSVDRSDLIDSDTSIDISPSLEEQNLLNFTQVKVEAMSYNWIEIYKSSAPEPSMSNFTISHNDCYEKDETGNHEADEAEDN